MTKIPFGPCFYLDTEKCTGCGACVRACQKQTINHLALKKEGGKNKAAPLPNECIYCGMCFTSCPVQAFSDLNSFTAIEKAITDKNKTVVCQIAPAVRSTIGESFDLLSDISIINKLSAGLIKLGFDYIFDTCVGADITTIEECKEAEKRIKTNKNLPIFSSCCPSWVKFVESYYPQFKKNLSTVKSPQIILGGLIKKYWAKKKNIDIKNVVVVSIMPCVSKKYEITKKKLMIDGHKPVDYVLTTREIIKILKDKKIDLKNIAPRELDQPFASPSGAGIIYGASGGVIKSVLRNTKGKKLKIKAVSGLNEAKILLESLIKNPNLYDCVEVMACKGGCINGGGQPFPVSDKIKKKRALILKQIDKQKTIKAPQENPTVKKIYKEFLNQTPNICGADSFLINL